MVACAAELPLLAAAAAAEGRDSGGVVGGRGAVRSQRVRYLLPLLLRLLHLLCLLLLLHLHLHLHLLLLRLLLLLLL
jgi:hypothetical protein